MNFSQKIIQLSSFEISELRKDYRQGWVGIAIVEIIGIAFTLFFSGGLPKADFSNFGFWFGLSPIIATSCVAAYLAVQLVYYQRDIKDGNKYLVSGKVENKFYKIRSSNKSSTLTSVSERTTYFIVVDKKKYLINASDFEKCRVGSNVKMYVTHYSKRVYEIQFS